MKININFLKDNFPTSIELLSKEVGLTSNSTKLIDFLDTQKVRVFEGQGASGGYTVNVYRKKTNEEFIKENPNKDLELNWQMKRIGCIPSFLSRDKAKIVGITMGFKELEFLLTNVEQKVDLNKILKSYL